MRKKIFTVGLLLLAMLCAACSSNGSAIDDSDKQVENSDNRGISDEELYDALFDIDTKVSIDIDISDEELLKLEEDYEKFDMTHYKSPVYRKADVTITVGDEVYEIPEVGVRMKGNTSRTDFYSEDKGIYNLIHLKLSFDETFDNVDYYGEEAQKWESEEERRARKDRTFATLDKLEVKWNKNYDNTYVRQRYSYEMFREFGVLAPQSSFAQILFGGENYGVYMISEPVDKKFIERNLPQEEWGGDLYKAAWTFKPADYTLQMTYGIVDPDIPGSQCNLDLKTNKKTSNHQNIKHLLEVLNGTDVTAESFSEVVDTEQWIKFTAVSYFLGNPDDLRNNYNNHYIYFLPNSKKAVFIPYDYDRTLGITRGYNPDATGMTEVSPFSESAEGNGSHQKNPLYIYSILSGGFYQEEYKEMLEAIAESDWMQPERIKAEYEAVKTVYEDVVIPEWDFKDIEEERLGIHFDGEFNYCQDKENIAVDDYMERILTTYHSVIAQS